MLAGLFPELNSPGGIQKAGQHLAAVLAEFAASRRMEYRFLSLNDPPELQRLSVGGLEFVFTGCQHNKARFAATALRTALRGAKLILAVHPNLAPVAWMMKLLAPHARMIVCAHGIEVWDRLPVWRRHALLHADLLLAPSQDTANHLVVRQGVPRERIRVLPWALDPQFEELLSPARQGSLPLSFPTGRVILAVGRLSSRERYKGVDQLIAAMPRLLTRWPNLHLAVVGDGDDRPRLQNLAAEHGVRWHVHFLSGVSPAGLAACYARCDLFALPSSGEGFGLVYLEAMASGKPVIGGAHGGAPEVIQDGVTGYLVPQGDVAQIVAAVDTLLSHPDLAREMGFAGRALVQRDFRFSSFSKSFRAILQEQCES